MLSCKKFLIKVRRVTEHPMRYYVRSPKEVFTDMTGTGYVEYYYRYHLAQVESDTVDDPSCVTVQLENMGFRKVGKSYIYLTGKRSVVIVEPVGKSFTVSVGYRQEIRFMMLYCRKPRDIYKDVLLTGLKKKIEENAFNELLIAEKVKKLGVKKVRGNRAKLKVQVSYYNVVRNVSRVLGIDMESVPYLITLI